MLLRAVTVGSLFIAMMGCGDDSAPGGHVDAAPDTLSTSDGASPGDCDPVAQSCATGQRCTLNHNTPLNTTFCETGNGTQAEFMSCAPTQSSDNCLRGTVCLGVNATTSVCRKFCNDDGDCGPNVCAISIEPTNGPLHACAQTCMVLQQSTCTITGEACYLGLTTMGQPTQQCNTAGTKTDGERCDLSNQCLPGLLCIDAQIGDASGGFRCHKACNFGTAGSACIASSDCANNGSCCPFVNQGGLGYCQ
jgi:hypothetical protein